MKKLLSSPNTGPRRSICLTISEQWAYGCTLSRRHESRQKRLDDGSVPRACAGLIATEAGGEGINLQFCHHMINFDLPWNPMRVEQRIGRVHRLGQTE